MRLKSPTTLKLKTNIIGTILIIPLIAIMTAILTATKIEALKIIATVLSGFVAVMLLAVVIMMAYLGYCILRGKE